MFIDCVWGQKSYRMVSQKMNRQMMKKMISQLFLIAASIELIMAICSECKLEVPHSRFILWGLLLVYGLKVVSNQYSAREYAVFAFILVLGIANYISGGINAILKAGIFLYALKGEDYKKIVRYLMGCLITVSIVMYIRALTFGDTGLMYMQDVRINRGFDGLRYTFGYSNSNRFMGTVFTIVMMILYILQPEIRKALIVSGICMLIVIVLYYFTDTRTVPALTLFVLVLYNFAIGINKKWINRIITGIFEISSSIEVLLSVLASCHVNNFLMSKIDTAISGRFKQLGDVQFTQNYPLVYAENWHFLSSYDNQAGCDLGFAFIFYYYGVIAAIVLICFIVYTAVMIYRQKEYYKFTILTGLCTYTFMEIYFFSNYISKNFLLIFCALTVWESRQGRNVNGQEEVKTIDHYPGI